MDNLNRESPFPLLEIALQHLTRSFTAIIIIKALVFECVHVREIIKETFPSEKPQYKATTQKKVISSHVCPPQSQTPTH